MALVNIPVIAYIDGTTRQMVSQIIADDNAYQALYQAWSEAGKPDVSNDIFATWSDVELTTAQAQNVINDYLNSYIVSNKLKFYCANTLEPGADISMMLHDYGVVGVLPEFYPASTNLVTQLVTLDNVDLFADWAGQKVLGNIDYDPITHNSSSTAVNFPFNKTNMTTLYSVVYLDLAIYPSDIFENDAVTGGSYSDETDPVFNIKLEFAVDNDVITGIRMRWNGFQIGYGFTSIVDFYEGVDIDTPGTTEDDLENPYGYEGTSGPGGGGGKYGDIDGIEATDIPDLPSVNAASLGLITLYNPTAGVVNNLASYLWSGVFDPDTFKKLFADPMGCMIGLSVVPAIPSTGGSKNIRFGNVDSGISCPYLSSNYVNVDCGSVAVDEYVGSFLDYEPHVKLNLFLPYVGFVPLSADDIVGGSINVQYNVDVLSGHCVAFVKHSTRGVLYSYSGSCITNIPLTAQSFSQALQSYYSGLAGVAGAAAGALGSGGAGLVSLAGQMANTAMNTAFNMHPNFQRSGGMGGAAAIMGVQKPFIVIQRPRFSVPMSVTHYAGLTSNMTRSLGSCSGFTMCEYVHLDNISATSEEIMEMESMLKQGVIL